MYYSTELDMNTLPQIIGVSELQRTLTSFIQQVKDSSATTVIVSRSRPQAVIMSPSRYAELMRAQVEDPRTGTNMYFEALQKKTEMHGMPEAQAMKLALHSQKKYRQTKRAR